MAQLADSTKIPELRPLKNIELANKRNIKRTDSALYYYQLAIKDSALLKPEALTQLLHDLSVAFTEKRFYKEAMPYVTQAINILENQAEKKDSEWTTLLNGKSLLFWVNLKLKDTATAFQNLQSSLEIVKQPGVIPKPELYSDLGNYYLFRNLPDSALFYFDILEQQVKDIESKSMRIRPLLFKAKAYILKKEFSLAKEYLKSVNKIIQIENVTSDQVVRDYIRSEYLGLKYETEKALGYSQQALLALEELRQLDNKKSEAQQSDRLAELERKLTEARAEKTIAANELEIKEQKRYNQYLLFTALAIILIAYLTCA